MRLTVHLAIKFLMANYCMRWCGIFKGSYRMGDGRIFQKNLRDTSINNKDLSNEPSFGLLHLADSTFKALNFFSINTQQQ